MCVLTVFTIVEYILTVFSSPHYIWLRVPCRLAHESHVSCLSNNHIGTGVPVQYSWRNCSTGRSYKRKSWYLVSFGCIVWKLALNSVYKWVIRFVRWFAVFFFLWYYIPWWELTSSLRLRDNDVFTRWWRNPMPNPQTGGPGYPFQWALSPLTFPT